MDRTHIPLLPGERPTVVGSVLSRIRRLRWVGPTNALACRAIVSLRNRGYAANAAGNSRAAIAYWRKMVRIQSLYSSNTRYLRGENWTAGLGHIALLDFFAKRKLLGLHKADYIIHTSPNYIANDFYLRLWAQYFPIFIMRDGYQIVKRNLELREDWPLLLELNGEYLELHEAVARVNALWGNREPLIKLPEDAIFDGWSHLKSHNVKWFVTFHIRHAEEPLDSIRNVRFPWTYQRAIYLIWAAGGQVVLMGKPGIKLGLRGVIDLRGSPDWLDCFLLSQCRFFLGSNSGPSVAAATFGTPLAIANFAPLGTPFPYAAHIAPKRIWNGATNLSDEAAKPFFSTTQLAERELILIDSTPNEIASLCERMIEATS